MNRTFIVLFCVIIVITLAGCGTVMRHTKYWKGAVNFVEENFIRNFDQEFYIDTGDFFNRPDAYSLKEICIIIHGWARSADDIKNLSGPGSLYGMAFEYYDGRVWLINYPSSTSTEIICHSVELELEKELNKIRINRGDGKIPSIHVVSHSFGSLVIRYLVRKNNLDIPFDRVALIAPICDGLYFWIFTGLFKRHYNEEIVRLLMNNQKPYYSEYYQSANDVIRGSEFLEKLNTSTEELETVYNFYAIDTEKKDNLIQSFDTVVMVNSAYPYNKLLKKGKFENVLFGNIVIFKGENIDHFNCLQNEDVMRIVFEDITNISQTSRVPPRWSEVTRKKIY